MNVSDKKRQTLQSILRLRELSDGLRSARDTAIEELVSLGVDRDKATYIVKRATGGAGMAMMSYFMEILRDSDADLPDCDSSVNPTP